MIDGIRKRLISEPAAAAVRESLLVATMLFERAVWLIRDLRIPTWQVRSPVGSGETAP